MIVDSPVAAVKDRNGAKNPQTQRELTTKDTKYTKRVPLNQFRVFRVFRG